MKREDSYLVESSLKRIPLETMGLGLVIGFIAIWLFNLVTGILIFVGSGLAALSFLTLKSFVNRNLDKKKALVLRRAILAYVLRLLLICLVLLIIIFLFKGKVIALVAGFSLIIAAILIEALRNLLSIKQWKA
ncbi:MAG: ATP synthase subunit I [Candidatus Saccharicenans sp.]